MRTLLGHRICTMAGIAAILVLGAKTAHAYIDGGDKACGCSPAGWNVPEGAVVSTRGSGGPITGLITALGEYYSHSMLSHGPGSDKWVSHSTMYTPGVHVNIFGDDDMDVNELRFGYPGPAQINMGGAYKASFGSPAAAVYTSGGTRGQQAAQYFWSGLPYCGNIESGLCYIGVYSNQDDDYSYDVEYLYIIARKQGGTVYRHSYGLYQYMNDHEVPAGDDTSDPGWAQQCSTFMAWTVAVATGQPTTSGTYPSTVLEPVALQLHDSLTNECEDGAGWFGGLFVDCEDIADQVINCFTHYDNCDDDARSIWRTVSQTQSAESVSPDRILGIHGHTNTNSAWAGKPQQQVQWNSGGSVCGCWF